MKSTNLTLKEIKNFFSSRCIFSYYSKVTKENYNKRFSAVNANVVINVKNKENETYDFFLYNDSVWQLTKNQVEKLMNFEAVTIDENVKLQVYKVA